MHPAAKGAADSRYPEQDCRCIKYLRRFFDYWRQRRKGKATLKNSELLNTLKEIDVMSENEQNMLLHYVNAYIRDFEARKAYAL